MLHLVREGFGKGHEDQPFPLAPPNDGWKSPTDYFFYDLKKSVLLASHQAKDGRLFFLLMQCRT
jgi:hypothetical protein